MDDSLVLHSFSIPVDSVELTKSKSGKDEEWTIQGLASTNSLDQQGEIVLVKGLDLSYLDSGRGTFNWNHRGDSDPSSVVGIITESRRTPNNELFIKGKLLKSLPKARHVYDLLKALQKDCPDRKMGMSIEGKVLARNGNQIVKAWVKAVALTLDPVNKDTWVSFAKSMETYEVMTEADEPLSAMPVSALEDMVEKGYNMPAVERLTIHPGQYSGGGEDVYRRTKYAHGKAEQFMGTPSMGTIECEGCGKEGVYKDFHKVPSQKEWRNNDLVCSTCQNKRMNKSLGDFDCDLCGANAQGEPRAIEDESEKFSACSNCEGVHKDFGWDGINKMQELIDEEETIQKNLVATLNPNSLHSDNPLLPESLESRLHDLGYAGGGKKGKSIIKRGKRKKRKLLGEKMHKSYSPDEAVERLKSLCPTLSDALAHQIVHFTLKQRSEEV